MAPIFFAPRATFDALRELDIPAVERAALFADLARLNTLSMIAYAGSGHIGSSFSSLDIVSWLFLEELRLLDEGSPELKTGWPYADVYFSSKGHDVPGLYTVLMALGILPEERRACLRRLGGLPGHPDVRTPGIWTNSGSLGQGVSKAKGLAMARRLQGRTQQGHIYVLTGDGELQEGQFWESLVGAANRGLSEITVIVDHNKIQSDIWLAQTSDLGDLEAKFRAFGWWTGRCDGHDFKALRDALAASRQDPEAQGKPRIILADTVKGHGVSFMTHDVDPASRELYRFHSGAPSREHYERAVGELTGRIDAKLSELGCACLQLETVEEPERLSVREPQKLIPAYSEALLAEARRDGRIVALDADLKLDTGLIPFEEAFPERFIECGIAEQDMVSAAGGLALAGMLPVCHSFACFMPPRANEQIFSNASEGSHVLYVGSLAGVVPGGPGHSHQMVRDMAALSGVPGMVMLEPGNAAEVAPALAWLLHEHDGPGYLRLISIPVELPHGHHHADPAEFPQPGRGTVLREGDDVLLIAYGPVLLAEAWHAAEALAKQGVSVKLVNLPWLNRVDPAWLAEAAAGVRLVVHLDNHMLEGGQGQHVAEVLGRTGLCIPLARLGLTSLPPCGQNAEVLAAVGLDRAAIAARVLKELGLAEGTA